MNLAARLADISMSDLVVSVTDIGPCVPKGKEESIFQKFARGAALETEGWQGAESGSRGVPSRVGG